MKLTTLIIPFFIVLLAAGCKSNEEQQAPENLAPGAVKVTILDVLQTSNYTYLQMDDYGDIYWGAVTKMDVNKGETLYYIGSMEMKNFHSEELDKDFESVLFIEKVSREPIVSSAQEMQSPHGSAKHPAVKSDIKIDPAEGGITVAELYAEKAQFANKTIKIRGKVTKFNPNIMGKNWVHLQDGTEYEGNFDITITTDDKVSVGEIVTFEGSVALDMDFGFGYKYDVIIEVGKLEQTTSL